MASFGTFGPPGESPGAFGSPVTSPLGTFGVPGIGNPYPYRSLDDTIEYGIRGEPGNFTLYARAAGGGFSPISSARVEDDVVDEDKFFGEGKKKVFRLRGRHRKNPYRGIIARWFRWGSS